MATPETKWIYRSSDLRKYHGKLCDALHCAPDVALQSLAGDLYSGSIIDMHTKAEVLRHPGYKGAAMLMDSVDLHVQRDPIIGEKVLNIMSHQDCLRDIVQEIPSTSSCSSDDQSDNMENSSVSSYESRTHKTEEEVFEDAKILDSKFETLLDKFLSFLEHIAVDRIQLKLSLLINKGITLPKRIHDILDKVDEKINHVGVIGYLVRHGLLGYLNHRLLEAFTNIINNERWNTLLKDYETARNDFLKSTDLKTLAQVFHNHPSLAPKAPPGLPVFTVHLDSSWDDSDCYRWNELLENLVNWPPFIYIKEITNNCIIIEYGVLPFFAPAVVRDLTDPEILSILEGQGVIKIDLSEQLRQDASSGVQHHKQEPVAISSEQLPTQQLYIDISKLELNNKELLAKMKVINMQLDDSTQQDSLSEDDKKKQTIVTSEKDQSTATEHTQEGLEPSDITTKEVDRQFPLEVSELQDSDENKQISTFDQLKDQSIIDPSKQTQSGRKALKASDKQLDDSTQQDSLSEDDKKEQTIVTSEKDQSTATEHTHSDEEGLEPSYIKEKNTLKAVQDKANATTTSTLLKEGSDDIHTTKADQVVDIEDLVLDYVMVSDGSHSTPKADKMDPYNDAAERPARKQFDLKCMICHEKTSNPIMFSCLDIFCLKCLTNEHKRQQEQRRSLTILRRYPLLRRNTTPPPSPASSAGTYNTVQGGFLLPHRRMNPSSSDSPLLSAELPSNPPSPSSTTSYDTVGGSSNGNGASTISNESHSAALINSNKVDPFLQSSSSIVDDHEDNAQQNDNDPTHPVPTHPTDPNQVLGPWYGDDDEAVDNEWFCCPLCHVQTDISLNNTDEEVVKHLMNRINIPLRNIDHFTSLQDNLPQGRIRCQKCNDNIATGVCCGVVCNYRPLCTDCQHGHMRYAAAATAGINREEHSIIPVASMEHLKRVDETCIIKDNYERHKPHDKPRMLYCKQHDEVICRSCTMHGNKHENCEVKECVGEVHREAKEAHTEEKLRAVHQIHTRMNEALKETETRKNSLKRSVEEKKGLIELRYAVLEQKLKDQRDSLLRDCDALYRHKLDELHQHHLELGGIFEPMNRCTEFVTWFKETSIASEFMMLKTQINQRLEELYNAHCNDRYEPYEDNVIYFDESEFDIKNEAIGRVYSSPSVKKFKLDPVKNRGGVFTDQPLSLSIVPRDAIENDISMYPDIQAPKLLVSIKHIDSGHKEYGCVIKDSKTGRYSMTVCPTRNGDHELSVYRPMKSPYSDRYVQQKALIHVKHGLTHSIRQQLRVILDKIVKAILDSEYY